MIQGVKHAARALGWRSDHVHFETFGPPPRAKPGRPVLLRLLQSEIDVPVQPGQSLLEAMEEAGAWVGSECRRGECGKCTLEYTEGEIRTPRRLPERGGAPDPVLSLCLVLALECSRRERVNRSDSAWTACSCVVMSSRSTSTVTGWDISVLQISHSPALSSAAA